MTRARDESEVLLQMEHHLDRYGKIGATSPGWTAKKRAALDFLSKHIADSDEDDLLDALDVGIGDMSHIDAWKPFVEERVLYCGIDGSERILDLAEARFPTSSYRIYVHGTIGDLVQGKLCPWEDFLEEPPDLVICLDVLYHIPSDELYAKLVRRLADYAGRYLLVSYATSMDAPGQPKKPGDPGFAWFPRAFRVPDGFEEIHSATNAGCRQPQKQALSLLRRI